MTTSTTDVRMPPGPHQPKAVQGAKFIMGRQRHLQKWASEYGGAFMVDLPMFGKTVVLGDDALIKQVFATNADQFGLAGNLGAVFGPGSTFGLDGDEHRKRRKLLVPPFAGKRMAGYEAIVEQEVLREVRTWPDRRSFACLPSMMNITVKAILRAVFGAEGPRLDELSVLLPKGVTLGAHMAVMPDWLRRDFGPLSPWGRVQKIRRRYDQIVAELIAEARADPNFDQRTDVLSMMLQARYDDGSPISDGHIADELLTLLAAGHETTASTLAWCIERMRRHPQLLSELAEETDAGGSALRQALIWEVQRVRPVIDGTLRRTRTTTQLGPWILPANTSVYVGISLSQLSDANYSQPTEFDPYRFIDTRPDTSTWIPFGGGIRRCIGASFANMEMNVVLRILLREFIFLPTTDPDEHMRSRGVAAAPGRGGRTVVYRRSQT